MDTEQSLSEKFTEKGLKDLKQLFKTYVDIFNENKRFKEDLNILGFGIINIEDREECFGRIRCLSDLLHIQFKLTKIENEKVDFKIEYGSI